MTMKRRKLTDFRDKGPFVAKNRAITRRDVGGLTFNMDKCHRFKEHLKCTFYENGKLFYTVLLLVLIIISCILLKNEICNRCQCRSDQGLSCKGKHQNCTQATYSKRARQKTSLRNRGHNLYSSGYKYFDWNPSKTRDINDTVNDVDFKYNRLDKVNPKQIRLDRRDIVPLEIRTTTPAEGSSVRIYLVDDFLSSFECDMLIDVHEMHVQALTQPLVCFANIATLRYHLRQLQRPNWQATEADFITGTRCLNTTMSDLLVTWGLRWSKGTAFYPGESKFSLTLNRRLEDVLSLNGLNGGPFRVVSYLSSVGYRAHTDCSRDGHKGKNDRFATALIYLNDVAMGGHTNFPILGVSVKPKKGRALVWNSMTKTGHCDSTSIHAALPAVNIAKYILQRWYYYDNFPGVSQRPPVPPIPERGPRQAMVHCDGYRNGGCRLYDTWTYDVLTHW